jgi:hypothetical protein
VTNPSDALLSSEPESNFPLGFYEYFLSEIRRREIVTLTYDTLFAHSSDFDYENRYPQEFKNWTTRRDPNATYLLIQHDIDNHPEFTRRMVQMEMRFGIKTNIFMFVNRANFSGSESRYDIDHDFFLEAESKGYPIGYHQNALSLTQDSLDLASARYLADVVDLRRRYKADYVVPHGGQGVRIDGIIKHNFDVPIPDELRDSLRWVYNKYGMTFHKRWSDGGLRKVRDKERLENMNLVDRFLGSLKPGTRNFCLIHPQRWGLNVNPGVNPMLEKMDWYQRVCREYS